MPAHPSHTLAQLRRCVVILKLTTRGVRLADLAIATGVVERTVLRDFQFLRDLGAAFDFNASNNAWYLRDNGFEFWFALKAETNVAFDDEDTTRWTITKHRGA